MCEARNKRVAVRTMLRWLAITAFIVLIIGIITDSGSSSPVPTGNSQSSYNSLGKYNHSSGERAGGNDRKICVVGEKFTF